jgi:hypothetical protein
MAKIQLYFAPLISDEFAYTLERIKEKMIDFELNEVVVDGSDTELYFTISNGEIKTDLDDQLMNMEDGLKDLLKLFDNIEK